MDSWIYGEGRTQIPEITCYDRSSGTRSRIDRVYADIKIASSTKIDHKVVSFTDYYNAIFIDGFPSKLKLGKIHGTLIILFYVSLSSPQLQILFFIENTKNPTIQQVNLVLKMLELSLKIQENIRISILKRRLRKENFKPEIKPMIKNLQDELSQLENKEAKSVKLHANTLDGG